jgi:uncharacterized protein (TIGR03000 family)
MTRFHFKWLSLLFGFSLCVSQPLHAQPQRPIGPVAGRPAGGTIQGATGIPRPPAVHYYHSGFGYGYSPYYRPGISLSVGPLSTSIYGRSTYPYSYGISSYPYYSPLLDTRYLFAAPPAIPSLSAIPAIPAMPADQRARIELRLPREDARVWLDGHETSSKGTLRFYNSPPLTGEEPQFYQLRVTWQQDGQEVRLERTVPIAPGQTSLVDFTKTNTGLRMPPADD